MKIVFYLTFPILLFSCTPHKQKNTSCIFPKNSLEAEGLKGSVLSVRTQVYNAKEANGQIEKDGRPKFLAIDDNSLIKFSKNGFLSEAYYYDNETMEQMRKELILLNREGCPSEVKMYEKERLDWTETYEYDLSKMEVTNNRIENGKNAGKTRTKYGNHGEEFMIYFDTSGKVTSKTTYTYNEKGDQTITAHYDSVGKLLNADTIRYDYNINSRSYSFALQEKMFTIVEIRNRDGLVTEKVSKNGDDTYKYSYKYEFDKNGNWTKKIEFEDSKPRTITEREIKYY